MDSMLKIKSIIIDGGTQTRAGLNPEVVDQYAESMIEGVEFPPVVVFYDGDKYWLADGFHRVGSSKKAGFTEISAEIKQGTKRDATLYSLSANSKHGLRRTNADKRRAVEVVLNDEEWGGWSDNRIAQACGVSQPFVSNIRSSLKTVISEKTYTTKHGTTATMNTANIGKTKQESISCLGEIHDTIEINEKEDKNNEEIFQACQIKNEIDYTEELVFELYDTIVRRYEKLKNKDRIAFKSLLIEKLNKL